MKKIALFAAFAAVAICSCQKQAAESDGVVAATQETPISFSTYTSGVKSTITTADTVGNRGFGVFAFYQEQTKLEEYSLTNYQPNFMYNQKVKKNGSNWEYAPVKYWPNTLGALVSFFAYAPYVAGLSDDEHTITPKTNQYLQESTMTDEGLRLVLGYDNNGPAIEYNVNTDPQKGFDLLYGVADGSTTSPYDVAKPAIGSKIKFDFKHALSRLDFDIQVLNDVTASAGNQKIADSTVIEIKSVTLKGNFVNQGVLRLYDGQWIYNSSNKNNEPKSIVFEKGKNQFADAVEDGLKNGEAVAAIPLLKGVAKTSASPAQTKNNYLMLIPGAKFYIEIVYDVTTTDPGNAKNTSTVTNTVSSTDINPTTGVYTLEQGKAYMFHLTLGMTSAKFDASVTDWDTEAESTVELPANTI